MLIDRHIQQKSKAAHTAIGDGRWLFRATAATVLIVMLAAFLLHWSIPSTGITIDVPSGTIVDITPGSAADHAGLRPGDQVRGMYDYRWSESDKRLWLFPLDWQHRDGIPMQLMRDGASYAMTLAIQPPAWDERLGRITWSVLAGCFWLTGVLLGVAWSQQAVRTPLVAWVWLGLAAITGVYHLVSFGSYPLTVLLLWLLMTLGMPFAVSAHIWFPPRPVPPAVATRARRWLIRTILALQIGLALLVLVQRPTVAELRDLLSELAAPVLTLGLVVTGVLLWRAYRQTTIAHTRRQIRLVAIACALVAGGWGVLRIIPALLARDTFVTTPGLNMLIVLVPLAYLAGAFLPDLYRIDRLVLRVSVHFGTIVTLALLIGVVASLLDLHGPAPALWMAVAFVVGYRPLYQAGVRLLPPSLFDRDADTPLRATAHALTTTLDRDQLEANLIAGVRAAFGAPLAYYRGDDDDAEVLRLIHQERLSLPLEIPLAVLDGLFGDTTLLEQAQLTSRMPDGMAASERDTLAYLPGIALWCQLRAAQGKFLGVLLLGRRDDLDPYRPHDLSALRQALDAAMLALSHSAEYRERQQAEATIRDLFQRMQQLRDQAAADLARDIHDEMLNGAVWANIQALGQLLHQATDPALREAIRGVLTSEQAVSRALRQVCERLDPTGINDPFGFPAVVRQVLDKARANWSGTCRLTVTGDPHPIPTAIQRELLRIIREAVVNAIKHSGGSTVAVVIHHHPAPESRILVMITDNGRQQRLIRPYPDSWGVRNMIESARAAGATLDFQQTPDGGTRVVVAVALAQSI